VSVYRIKPSPIRSNQSTHYSHHYVTCSSCFSKFCIVLSSISATMVELILPFITLPPPPLIVPAITHHDVRLSLLTHQTCSRQAAAVGSSQLKNINCHDVHTYTYWFNDNLSFTKFVLYASVTCHLACKQRAMRCWHGYLSQVTSTICIWSSN